MHSGTLIAPIEIRKCGDFRKEIASSRSPNIQRALGDLDAMEVRTKLCFAIETPNYSPTVKRVPVIAHSRKNKRPRNRTNECCSNSRSTSGSANHWCDFHFGSSQNHESSTLSKSHSGAPQGIAVIVGTLTG